MSQKSKLEERQKILDAAMRSVLADPNGRLVFATLIDDCGLYHPSPDMGKRSVALGIRAKALKLDPKLWFALEAEIVARRIEPENKPKEIEDE